MYGICIYMVCHLPSTKTPLTYGSVMGCRSLIWCIRGFQRRGCALTATNGRVATEMLAANSKDGEHVEESWGLCLCKCCGIWLGYIPWRIHVCMVNKCKNLTGVFVDAKCYQTIYIYIYTIYIYIPYIRIRIRHGYWTIEYGSILGNGHAAMHSEWSSSRHPQAIENNQPKDDHFLWIMPKVAAMYRKIPGYKIAS